MKKNVKNSLIGILTNVILINKNKLIENNTKILTKNIIISDSIINKNTRLF